MEFSAFGFTLFQSQKTVEEKSISRRKEEAVEAAERVNSVNVMNVSHSVPVEMYGCLFYN